MAERDRYFAAGADFDEEDARLRLIEQSRDPDTFRDLERLGVGPGWRCLEVAAGAGSVTAWLASRVGPSGDVVAIDIDISHLQWLRAANVSVRTQDVLSDGVGVDEYDLVHCRALLEHIDRPGDAVRNMAQALRPGGWLVAEGANLRVYRATNERHRLAATFGSVMAQTFSFTREANIFDSVIATTLPAMLTDAGLESVEVEERDIPTTGGDPMAIMFEMSWQRFDPLLVSQGIITTNEAAARQEAHHDPTFSFVYGAVFGRGRRPDDGAN